MRFSVPQFIEVEDKIFGQLTLKQGLYVLGSVGLTVAIFIKFGIFFAFLLGAPILFLAFLLSFVKVHGQQFINLLYSATFYIIKNKLYLWKKTQKTNTSNIKKESLDNNSPESPPSRPITLSVTQSKLRELASALDAKKSFDKNEHSF